ncbi:hypothetical protein WIS52_17950 [Pseudonocardia nematodicida]|uniref:Uncharacterized protein n=1 Tax=Pseudonocardia nematodicida TaxID=1206997 RepID=A0ABV1KD24_9PSEU
MYAYLDDGPHAGERMRIEPGEDGRPPRTVDLTGPDGDAARYELLGPHHNDDWWIYRRARGTGGGRSG